MWNVLPPAKRRDAMSFDTAFYYRLTNSFLGAGQSLDVIPDGSCHLKMAQTGNYSGQFWTLALRGDGTYKLTNDFTGPGKSLDTYSDSHQPFLDTGDHSGQHWTLTPLTRIPD